MSNLPYCVQVWIINTVFIITITKPSNLHSIDRLQRPWLTVSIRLRTRVWTSATGVAISVKKMIGIEPCQRTKVTKKKERQKLCICRKSLPMKKDPRQRYWMMDRRSPIAFACLHQRHFSPLQNGQNWTGPHTQIWCRKSML